MLLVQLLKKLLDYYFHLLIENHDLTRLFEINNNHPIDLFKLGLNGSYYENTGEYIKF